MAKKQKRITDLEPNEPRADVTWRYVGLVSAFAVLLVISVITVLIPELRDDGAEEEADAAGSASDEPAVQTPTATDAPAAPAAP